MEHLLLANEFLIFFLTALGVYLAGKLDGWQKWGFVSGLLAQPFWFIHAFVPDFKPGIFLLTVTMTFLWSAGVRNHFMVEDDEYID